MRMYRVGGCVRDSLLGRNSKDIDFTVVFDKDEVPSGIDPFKHMTTELKSQGFRVFLESPEYFTIRAQFPDNRKMTADFVLARREGTYSDGRRPDVVEVGTLEDDLGRRDFTMNALAVDEGTGDLIDLHGGSQDVESGIIRAVGDPSARLLEDPLRALRAIRFSVVLGFDLDYRLYSTLINNTRVIEGVRNVSQDRIREELSKMFRYNTLESMRLLGEFPDLTDAIFSGSVSLDATLKTKGRGTHK